MVFFKKPRGPHKNTSSMQNASERFDFISPSKVHNPSAAGNEPNLTDIRVIYDGGLDSFSLGLGVWNQPNAGIENDEMLLMRWNGRGDDKGFPFNAGNPFWFPIPKIFAEDILSTLKWWIETEKETPSMLAKDYGFNSGG